MVLLLYYGVVVRFLSLDVKGCHKLDLGGVANLLLKLQALGLKTSTSPLHTDPALEQECSQ